ncbi:MAG TPA: hypothetical protein VM554_16225 [Acidisarcina sp.]|nr:hypothetical protein [Acidisarcina sp.]
MSFTINDGTQRFSADNSLNVEVGSATPSGPITLNGVALLSGSMLARSRVPSAALQRTSGVVASISPFSQVTASYSGKTGCGSCSAGIYVSATSTTITLANGTTTAINNVTYTVI